MRLVFLALCLAALGIAAYSAVRAEWRMNAERLAERTFDVRARTLTLLLSDMKAAQQAYVAAGQGEAFWIAKVTLTLETVRQSLADLRARARSAEAVSALDQALSSIDSFEQLDTRVRDYARNGQRLMASDLIFADGLELTAAAASQVDSARAREEEARESSLGVLRRDQLRIVAVTAAVAVLLITLLLLTVGVQRKAAVSADQLVLSHPGEDAERPAAAAVEEPLAQQPLRHEPRPALITPTPIHSSNGVADLRAVADLCTDLGRVRELREMPALLERAAHLLDATGLIVWITDSAGQELRPALAHGYAAQALSSMGAIAREDNNIAAAAFRNGHLETAKGGEGNNGAIVAPLVSPAGCIGVLSAEVRNGSESSESARATAAVLAAQFATMFTVPPVEPQ